MEVDQKVNMDYYWKSYSHFGIHEEMLKDSVRTKSYRKAIEDNPQLFKNKIVLDVGCGTGILSMFAVRAGASHVYAVDASDILDTATRIVNDNKLSDKITLIKGLIEEIELPVQHVDIIISEWMGYFLLYESMLNSVIFARDKWLTPGGIILPDKASMYIAAIEDGDYKDEKINFWDNVYGFDMSCVKKLVYTEPLVDTVNDSAIVSDVAKLITIDIHTVSLDDLSWTSPFRLKARQNDYVHAFVAWFDIEFTKCHKPIKFDTGPFTQYTHWKQTVLYLHDVLTVCEGEVITGSIRVTPNSVNYRHIDISLRYNIEGKYQQTSGVEQYSLR